MNHKFPLSSTAALIADPARAAMLTLLLDARPRSAGELAREANVSAQSASMHLSQLSNGGFLNMTRQGRHRYYTIAGRHIAHAIEALGAISTSPDFKPARADRELCYARTCYDHLAGELGVKLTAALERNQVLVPQGPDEYGVTRHGEKFLGAWQIDIQSLRETRRSFARRCLDWTERRYHVAGAVGAAICDKFLELRWITRDNRSRIVHLSVSGRRELARFLEISRFHGSDSPSSFLTWA
jgi:DNA-binding transcriptional ArsR family regulator